MTVDRGLIIDVGMSEGNDTAFYLQKGFSVVGVEADPTLHDGLVARFSREIADGRLRLFNRAATARSGETVSFWHDNHEQGHSALEHPARTARDGQVSEFRVTTIDWRELRAVAGVPYYLKVDIEGGEPEFLRAMVGAGQPPAYISAEVQTFRPIELFRDMGYRHFRLLNQTLWHAITLPDPPLEGSYAAKPAPHHWSGPFGRELPGDRWFSFAEIREIHDTLHRLWMYGTLIAGWMDCHAFLPEAAG